MVSHSSHIVPSTKGEIINENVCHCIFTLMFDFVVQEKFFERYAVAKGPSFIVMLMFSVGECSSEC